MATTTATGGEVLVATLQAAGVDRVFCVPGESFLAALDALYDAPGIQVVTCRHESGAGLMAIADARLTGRPGVCFVSRGPGAGNATLAIHVAQQDAVPMLFFIGQVERPNLGRGAFQEVDYVKTYADMAKWVVEVQDPARLSDVVARAWHEALAGTPGPVVISLPEDMLEERIKRAVLQPAAPRSIAPAAGDMARLAALLAKAQRPLLLAGGGCESRPARAALLAVSEAWDLPVAATNKRQTIFPNDHGNWVGHIGYLVPPTLRDVLAKADLVIALGTRLGDVSTQRYQFPRAPEPAQPLVHVYPDSRVVGRNHRPVLGIVADAEPTLRALAALPPAGGAARAGWIAELGAARDRLAHYEPRKTQDGIDFGHVALALNRQLAPDAIVTLDAGNFVSWIHGFVRFQPTQDMLGAVGGAMGLAVPAAVAASLRCPQRQVVALVGDGGMLMTGYELATAMQTGAAPKIFVANNGSYGVIRTHQEGHYPGRPIATALCNPDFAAMARSFGATGLTIATADQAESVVAEALSTPGAVVVDVHTSLERINAYRSLADFRPK